MKWLRPSVPVWRAALAGRVDGVLVDTSYSIDRNADLAIVTDKDADGLGIIRHSTAHLLAYAVKELFPEAQVTIGPEIENGFYYDFAYKRPFTPEDLTAIEKKMSELAKKDIPVERYELPRDEAVAYFKSIGEAYKAEIIESIPADQVLSLYREGEFTDLCRGPHVPSTGKLKVFKLMKVAGAYWRGDSKNEMLQRIYGTAWAKKEDLKPTSTCWKRRKSATTASWVCSWTCSTCRMKRRAWCSGTPRAGSCGRTSSNTCAASW
jgi:threonyl-tRNA synthetase